ncbi:hypothetical protein NEOKW01_1451 [Nematocida sp. AWRm80]|nr:hypothetical protein NEOKW01_1451 [Nematocida sp. AWRm80]
MNNKQENGSLLNELLSVLINQNGPRIYRNQPLIRARAPLITMNITSTGNRLLSELDPHPIYSPEIKLYIGDLSTDQINFICATVSYICNIFNCRIVLESTQVDDSKYILVNTNIHRLCTRTHAYIQGIILQKNIVSFMWYTDLLEASKGYLTDLEEYNLQEILHHLTEIYIVAGDTILGRSDIPFLASKGSIKKKLFKSVNIQDPYYILSPYDIKLIKSQGGDVNSTKKKKLSIPIVNRDQLYNLILCTKTSPLYSRKPSSAKTYKFLSPDPFFSSLIQNTRNYSSDSI